jgi:hypothetical protein
VGKVECGVVGHLELRVGNGENAGGDIPDNLVVPTAGRGCSK